MEMGKGKKRGEKGSWLPKVTIFPQKWGEEWGVFLLYLYFWKSGRGEGADFKPHLTNYFTFK
jgi:hypothetical protein